jgi:glycosyltransferase involved in cell wall biosynthesis
LENGERFECVIAGMGPEEEALRRAVERCGVGDCVTLAGAVPQDRLLSDYFPRASVLVQPSVVSADGDQDGIPMVVLEAMAVGLPVVSTPVSGIPEAVIDDRTGLLVEAEDARELAERIRRILRDPALAARLAAGARAHIETRFDLKMSARLLHHLMVVSARGAVRWSNDKLRGKIGLPPLDEPASEERMQHADARA